MCEINLRKYIKLKKDVNKTEFSEQDQKRYEELYEKVKQNEEAKKCKKDNK